MNVQVKGLIPTLDKPFPKLMIVNNSNLNDIGTIVLFTKEGSGFAVYSPNNYREIGYYSYSFNMKCFTDFNGSITLSND